MPIPLRKFTSNTGVRIYRIPCQVFESLSARVYLLVGAGPPTLVDTGSGLGGATHQILTGLATIRDEFGERIQPGDIKRIIVSHGHVDHIGGLPELLRHTPAEVAIHPLDAGSVALRREHIAVGNSRLSSFFQQAGVDPVRRAELLKISHFSGVVVEGVEVGRLLEDGDELDGLRVIHTPGHSPGHLCIGVGNVLLSADHILAVTIPQQWPESTAAYTGLGHYLESLDKVRDMPGFELTLAAHEQVIDNVYGRIETIQATHKRRLDRLLGILGEAHRPMSVHEIAQSLYSELTGFRAVLAITDVGSRVEYLHQRGRLAVVNLDEVENGQNPVFLYGVV